MRANEAIYFFSIVLAATFYSAGQLVQLSRGAFSPFNFYFVFFFLLTWMSVATTLAYRKKLLREGQPLFSLSRPTMHIVGDFFCCFGLVGLLSLLVDPRSGPAFQSIVSLNSVAAVWLVTDVAFFAIGVLILRHFALKERIVQTRSKGQQA